MTTNLLTDLAKAKVLFQRGAILAAMGVNLSNSTPLDGCPTCGDHHEGEVPRECETGDGV